MLLYQDAVRGNQELRRQIISSQDSFGKIFRVTQQLDVTEPCEVFFKAVKVLGRLHFAQREVDALRELINCGRPDWHVLFDL